MGARINTIMQTCFFAISGVLPREEAIAKIKKAIKKTYGKKGDEVVKRISRPWIRRLAALVRGARCRRSLPRSGRSSVPPTLPTMRRISSSDVTAMMMAGKGDLLPVSAMPVDGTWPTGTTKWEKRNIAPRNPGLGPRLCIQCNKCAFVCPHAAIRVKVLRAEDAGRSARRPSSRSTPKPRTPDIEVHHSGRAGRLHRLQHLREVCPAKDKADTEPQGASTWPAGAAARAGSGELRVLPRPARTRPRP